MRTIRVYDTYVFRDKDPVIDQLRTMTKDAGVTPGEAATRAGLSAGTPNGWFKKKVRRPQNASIEAYGRALGMQRVWEKLPVTKQRAIERRINKRGKRKGS